MTRSIPPWSKRAGSPIRQDLDTAPLQRARYRRQTPATPVTSRAGPAHGRQATHARGRLRLHRRRRRGGSPPSGPSGLPATSVPPRHHRPAPSVDTSCKILGSPSAMPFDRPAGLPPQPRTEGEIAGRRHRRAPRHPLLSPLSGPACRGRQGRIPARAELDSSRHAPTGSLTRLVERRRRRLRRPRCSPWTPPVAGAALRDRLWILHSAADHRGDGSQCDPPSVVVVRLPGHPRSSSPP